MDTHNYYSYTAEELRNNDAVKYMDNIASGLMLEHAKVKRHSPRTITISYDDPAMGPSCYYEIARRDSKGHFSIKLTLAMTDGTTVNSYRFKDITEESLTAIVQKMYSSVKRSRTKAMGELDSFRKIVTDGLAEASFNCLGISPRSMAFRGDNMNVAISISELGIFKAIIRMTKKSGGIRRAFETGATVSKENAVALVNRIKSL